MRSPSLTTLAWLNVGLHAIGLVIAVAGMRPGTPLVPLNERIQYLAGRPLGWSLGWAVWALCAVGTVAFVAVVARRLGESAWLPRLAVTVTVTAAGFDLACDTAYVAVLPELAAATPSDSRLFLAAEKLIGSVSLVVANGAYSVAVLLITAAVRDRPGVTSLCGILGCAVFVCGALLAASGFTGVPWHTEWATGPTVVAFSFWMVVLARTLDSRVGE